MLKPHVSVNRTTVITTILFICLLFVDIFFSLAVIAETTTPAVPDGSSTSVERVKDLAKIIDSMDAITNEIQSTRNAMNSKETAGDEQDYKEKLDELNSKLDNLENNFNDLASEVSLDTVQTPSKMEFNWDQELKKILGPLIREIQRLTARPREIEKHRSDIESYDKQLQTINTATTNIKSLLESPSCSPRLKVKLNELLTGWNSRKNDIETLKNISRMKLDKLKGETQSLTQTMENIPSLFFKSHGKNFLLAFFAFIFIVFLFYKFHILIKKWGPLHTEVRSFYSRAFDLGYGILSGALCMGVVLGVLYLFSDWVLLSLVLVFLIGIVWTSKAAIPKVWHQAKIILNLGPVREGELVVHNGIPYKITSINMSSTLQNPFIPSAVIRLPLSDLTNMRSRPVDVNEPWFPSKVNDWVLVAYDTTYEKLAQVIAQTPETVLLKTKGGALLSFTSSHYMTTPIMNLSSGFQIRMIFGLHYNLQPIITNVVPDKMRKSIESVIHQSEYKDHFISLSTSFAQAAASALDIEIKAIFSGDVAPDYTTLKCLIQKTCVETCTEMKWNIPYSQLTIHMDDKHS